MTPTCPRCDSSVSDNAKFCPECGHALTSRTCPACGTQSDHGRFCAECGTPFDVARAGVVPAGTLSEPTALAAAAAVTAPAPVGPIAERRVTTVLFGDLVGFTSLAEGSDSEEVRELLSRYFAVPHGHRALRRNRGEVHRRCGDGRLGRAGRARGRRRTSGSSRARAGRDGRRRWARTSAPPA